MSGGCGGWGTAVAGGEVVLVVLVTSRVVREPKYVGVWRSGRRVQTVGVVTGNGY